MSVLQGGVYVAEVVADSDLSGAIVSVTVTAPDGTNPSVGTPTTAGSVASVPVTALMPGTYLLVWSLSGTVVGTVQDQFTCVAAELDLISLPDLKEELQITATDTRYDAKLRRWLKSATNVVENVTGPIRARTVTDMFDGGGQFVVLNDFWVSSITSVSENWGSTNYALTEQPLGFATSAYGYTWDRDTNVLVRRDQSGYARFFAPGRNSVQVVYRAGLPVLPDDIQMATARLINHWYAQSQPVKSGPFGSAQGDEMSMVGNYAIPNQVMELLEPWRRMPGIA